MAASPKAGQVISKFLPPPMGGLNYTMHPFEGDLNYASRLDHLLVRPQGIFSPGRYNQIYAAPLSTPETLFSTDGTFANAFGAHATAIGLLSTGYGAPTIAITSARGWATTFNAPGGGYTFFFNGVDTPKVFNAGVWSAVSFGGTCVPQDLFQALVYRRRLYMADKNALRFWYFPVDAVTGVEVVYNCGTVFSKGGKIVAMATLSIDGGNGPDDYLLVYTSTGQMAVFSGSDPAAADWRIVGVFEVGIPACGTLPQPKVLCKFGGDVLVYTMAGIFPMSEIIRGRDRSVVKSISHNVDPVLTYILQNTTISQNSTLTLITSQDLLLATTPTDGTFALNLRTGAWCRFPVTSGGLGATREWIELNDSGVIKTYGLADVNSVMQAFVPNTVYNYETWYLRYPYTRLGGLVDHRILQARPYLYGSSAPISSFIGVGYNLSGDYNEASFGASAGSFSSGIEQIWDKRTPTANNYYLFRPELTTVQEGGFASSILVQSLPGSDVAQFQFLGVDIRYETLARPGS